MKIEMEAFMEDDTEPLATLAEETEEIELSPSNQEKMVQINRAWNIDWLSKLPDPFERI